MVESGLVAFDMDDTLLNGLKLKAAAGTLTEEDVEAVNRLLGSS